MTELAWMAETALQIAIIATIGFIAGGLTIWLVMRKAYGNRNSHNNSSHTL